MSRREPTPPRRIPAEEERSSPVPPVVCVVGRKDSGKTRVTVALVAELRARGRGVMSAKHGHAFDLDTPGTDSWRHRQAGARRTLLAGPEELAVLGGWERGDEPSLTELVRRYLADAEIVVAEGWKRSTHPKIEVFRSSAHAEPLLGTGVTDDATFLAVATDRTDHEPGVPVFRLDDPELAARLADLVESRLL